MRLCKSLTGLAPFSVGRNPSATQTGGLLMLMAAEWASAASAKTVPDVSATLALPDGDSKRYPTALRTTILPAPGQPDVEQGVDKKQAPDSTQTQGDQPVDVLRKQQGQKAHSQGCPEQHAHQPDD